jgi:hypothetical protein
MLRHAEMPKEPRRVPTVVDGFIDGPLSTAPRVGFLAISRQLSAISL